MLNAFLQRRAAATGLVVEADDVAALMKRLLGGKPRTASASPLPKEGTPVLPPGEASLLSLAPTSMKKAAEEVFATSDVRTVTPPPDYIAPGGKTGSTAPHAAGGTQMKPLTPPTASSAAAKTATSPPSASMPSATLPSARGGALRLVLGIAGGAALAGAGALGALHFTRPSAATPTPTPVLVAVTSAAPAPTEAATPIAIATKLAVVVPAHTPPHVAATFGSIRVGPPDASHELYLNGVTEGHEQDSVFERVPAGRYDASLSDGRKAVRVTVIVREGKVTKILVPDDIAAAKGRTFEP